MPLVDLQFRKALRDTSLDILRKGKTPSLSALSKSLAKKMEAGAAPTMKVRLQGRRAPWNLGAMNSTLKEVSFDLETLYESFLDLAGRILMRLNDAEASARAQHVQLDRLENTTRNLLFLLQNGDAYFEGFFDDFHDLSKVDMDNSTPEVVDLGSQVAELPQNATASRKIVLSHMLDQRSWPVEVLAGSKVIRAETPADAPFSAMFTDVLTAWRHDVVTEQGGPLSITFTIPIHRVQDGGISLTRIQMIGISESPQVAEVEYTVDGKNWLKFHNAGQAVTLDRSSKYVNLDFPLTRVEQIRVTLTKQTHDRLVPGGYLTSFGLKHLGFYSIGRASEAVLVSKPFAVSADRSVEKVALSVFEDIPPGTDVLYYIGVAKKRNEDTPPSVVDGEWTPITPLNRQSRPDEHTRVVKTASILAKKRTYVPESPMDPFVTYKGVDYYRLNDATPSYADRPISSDVIFGTAYLFRGRNSWQRQATVDRRLSSVSDEYISFTAGPRQKLYVVSRETVNFGNNLQWDGYNRNTIEVSRPVDYRPSDGMSLVPPSGVDPFTVPDPLHSIYKVNLTMQTQEASEALVMPTSDSVKFTKGPIELADRQLAVTYLTAYDAQGRRVHDDDLILELESRPSLAAYVNKIVVDIRDVNTPSEVASGKPFLSRLTIGGSDQDLRSYVEGHIIETTPVPKVTRRDLSTLSDQQILDLFGRITVRTVVAAGLIGRSTVSPTLTYLPRQDFDFEERIDPQSGLRGLYVKRTPNSRITAGESVTFEFRYKTDLLPHVLAVRDNLIYLDNQYAAFPAGTKIQVAYRYVPHGSNAVLTETLRVALAPGAEPLIPGKDYHFNVNDGTITALTGGGLYASDGVKGAYATFSYEDRLYSLYNFATWAYVDSSNPLQIRFLPLGVNTEFGEKVVVSVGDGSFVDISGASEVPELSNGWHQFVVTSRDPDVYTGSAIQLMAELLDLEGNPVFLSGGKYFSKIEATRVPMTQVTEDFLKNSVLPVDLSKFAITDDGDILVNFQPNSQGQYYTYGYRMEDVLGTPTSILDHYNEQFDLEYDAHGEDAGQVEAVLLRIILRRQGTVDDGLTPKVEGYQIRVG